MSETPQPSQQGRTIWDVLPDTARALNDTADGFGCFLGCVLALFALAIVACTVIAVAQVLRP